MTVGISITNRRDAVVLSDAQVTWGVRLANNAEKAARFAGETYHGVINGSGDGNLIFACNRYASEQHHDIGLESKIRSIQQKCEQMVLTSRADAIAHGKKVAETHASAIADPDTRKRYLDDQTTHQLREAEEWERRDGGTSFLTTAYDADQKKIRIHYFTPVMSQEVFLDYTVIGSGTDAAHLEISKRTQGVDMTRLGLGDLLYLAFVGYAASTMNQGVGGTPSATYVDQSNTFPITRGNVMLMTNVAAFHLADPSAIEGERVKSLFGRLVRSEKADLRTIEKRTGVPRSLLEGTLFPYPALQERANRRLFKID